MKVNRLIAIAAIALLVVGAMSAFASRSWALSSHAPVSQADACAQDQADGSEVTSAEHTDNVNLQCGDQNSADGREAVEAADTDNVQEQVGDQSGPDNGVEAPEAQAPTAP